MKSLVKRNQGFTLIEIVIVLAIAAAIILMVFLAVAGVRRSQRDTQRRSDAARLAATVEQFAANNGGTYPGSGDMSTTPGKWYQDYVVTGKFYIPGSSSVTYSLPTTAVTGYSANGFGSLALPNVPPSTQQDAVYLDVNGSTYSVCIGGEAAVALCAQSK